MARIFDVIEYPNEMAEEIVHRFPDGMSDGEYRLGSNVIVRDGQTAVFFRDGLALDMFGPGRHVIATANIPLITNKLQDWFTGGKTVFPAEVYFVSMKEFANRKWGTPQPIIVRNPGMGLGVALLQGFGTYSFQVKDPQQFIIQIVGKQARNRRDRSFLINQQDGRLLPHHGLEVGQGQLGLLAGEMRAPQRIAQRHVYLGGHRMPNLHFFVYFMRKH